LQLDCLPFVLHLDLAALIGEGSLTRASRISVTVPDFESSRITVIVSSPFEPPSSQGSLMFTFQWPPTNKCLGGEPQSAGL
jgi:hypothetical protein